MKVLFAVSNESISEGIVKQYQKEYKEILSYKNVYYFNAILKEIQKDKTYDRIIISEELESFANNNYEAIDKFLFEKLDNISDEAQDSNGQETSIIFICTDRRTKGSSFLVKLFSIGVYNALLGNDRVKSEVCKLINKPRIKKEAKMYYKIDAEDATYDQSNEKEVSEIEIQSILSHFKKLGKNTDKYADSFNNIAMQYTDEQLKIIINCLPNSVKAVLEEDSPKYQEMMQSFGGIRAIRASNSMKEEEKRTGIKMDLMGSVSTKIDKPIIIPSSVRKVKSNTNKDTSDSLNIHTQSKVSPKVNEDDVIDEDDFVDINKMSSKNQKVVKSNMGMQNVKKVQSNSPVNKVVKSTQNMNVSENVKEMKKQTLNVNNSEEAIRQRKISKDISPLDFERNVQNDSDENADIMQNDMDTKRGRGRPRKTPIDMEPKPKGKRGRPRKVAIEDENLLPGFEEETEENLLPGFNNEQDDEIGVSNFDTEVEENEELELPGFDNEVEEDEELELPGFDDEVEEDEELELPGFDDEVEEDEELELPGFDDEVEEDEELELPGFDNEVEEDEELELPGFDDESEEGEELELPGFDEEVIEEDDESELPDFDEVVEEDDESVLSDFDEEVIEEDKSELSDFDEVEEDDESALSDFDDEIEEDEYTDEVSLPDLDGLDDIEDDFLPDMEEEELEEEEEIISDTGYNEPEETVLPGMGFEDEIATEDEEILSSNNHINNMNNNVNNIGINTTNGIESISSKVDYSMSSLNSLLTKEKKIVAFLGTTKNGTSFLINHLGLLFSSLGINTAILDMTKNKNSYYIYTKNEEELRKRAYTSISKLQDGYVEGIKANKNLSIYTALPNDGKDYSNAEPILSTLVQNYSLVLIDCDFDTYPSYFASCQELYLVQSMDILTIQPLTAFLKELKVKGVLEPEKIRVVVNKEIKVRGLTTKLIITGMSSYNDPSMSFMTELFNKDIVKACSIGFDENACSKYMENVAKGIDLSLNGYSKQFISKLRVLGEMVYPLTSKQTYGKKSGPISQDYSTNTFSNSMNNTLNQMRKKY